jgi:hypothetical protein
MDMTRYDAYGMSILPLKQRTTPNLAGATDSCWSVLASRARVPESAPRLARHRTAGYVEALHQCDPEEFRELSLVLERSVRGLHNVLGCAKEYAACYAELEHFQHVHFHVVPRAVDMPAHLRGAKSFDLLQASEAEAVPPEDVRTLCASLSAAFGDSGLRVH